MWSLLATLLDAAMEPPIARLYLVMYSPQPLLRLMVVEILFV